MSYTDYELINDNMKCTNSQHLFFNACDYYGIIRKLKEINYDHSGLLNGYVNGCKNIIEEVLINKKNIELMSDSSFIDYSNFTFVIEYECDNNAFIRIKDEGLLCEECYKKTNHPDIHKIKNVLKNPLNYLSVSKKIIYILNKSKNKLESKDIYELGKPWNITGLTQINTIQARCSTLHKNGFIKKYENKYFIE